MTSWVCLRCDVEVACNARLKSASAGIVTPTYTGEFCRETMTQEVYVVLGALQPIHTWLMVTLPGCSSRSDVKFTNNNAYCGTLGVVVASFLTRAIWGRTLIMCIWRTP